MSCAPGPYHLPNHNLLQQRPIVSTSVISHAHTIALTWVCTECMIWFANQCIFYSSVICYLFSPLNNLSLSLYVKHYRHVHKVIIFSGMCEKCSLLFLLIGTFVSLQSSDDSDSSRSDVSMRIIIVLDPAVYIQIKPKSTIRIYPPWWVDNRRKSVNFGDNDTNPSLETLSAMWT
jgi:hypothetical protein